jgi:hypothetical protein
MIPFGMLLHLPVGMNKLGVSRAPFCGRKCGHYLLVAVHILESFDTRKPYMSIDFDARVGVGRDENRLVLAFSIIPDAVSSSPLRCSVSYVQTAGGQLGSANEKWLFLYKGYVAVSKLSLCITSLWKLEVIRIEDFRSMPTNQTRFLVSGCLVCVYMYIYTSITFTVTQ